MALFIFLHLLNHTMILFSEQSYIEFMEFARKIYRNPIAESLLVLSIVIQVGTGIQLVWRKKKKQKSVFERLQLYSGLYFVYFLISHTSAIFVGRYYLRVDTNLYFGAAVVNISPALYFFIFHYGLAILAFFTHVGSLHFFRMQKHVSRKHANRQAWVILISGAVLAVLIVSKLMQVEVPESYLHIYDVFFE